MSGRVRMAADQRGARSVGSGSPWNQPDVDPFPTHDRLLAAYDRAATTLAAKAEKSGDPVDRRVADAFRELADAVAWDRT